MNSTNKDKEQAKYDGDEMVKLTETLYRLGYAMDGAFKTSVNACATTGEITVAKSGEDISSAVSTG